MHAGEMDTLSEAKQTPVPAAELHNNPTSSSDAIPLIGDKEAGDDQDAQAQAVEPEDQDTGATNAKRTRSAALTDKCTFYVKRKRRNCNAATVGGRDYCVEHSYLLGVSLLDPKFVRDKSQ